MYQSLKIVKIKAEYCNYLRQYDDKVAYNAGSKELRPFIGVLFMIGDMEYFAPLSSPKPKHILLKNSIDLLKINDGKYGVINFNNMIPVDKDNYEVYDLTARPQNYSQKRWLELLRNQSRWLNANKVAIINKSKRLYKLYKNKKLPDNVRNRCCNFILLEKKALKYK